MGFRKTVRLISPGTRKGKESNKRRPKFHWRRLDEQELLQMGSR